MIEKKKISIIVPIYNVGKYLEKCIASIIAQTYRDLEIILVNDGSTDCSRDICRKFAVIDDRIILLEQKNSGLVQARKSGIEHATGKYIGFVDGDDYIEPNMYEKLYGIMESMDIDIVHSGWIEDLTRKLPEQFIIEGDIGKNVKQYILNPQAGHTISPSVCSKLFRSDIIRRCYAKVPDSQSFGEDWIAFAVCICEGARIGSVKEAFYHYTVRPESLSHVNDVDNYQTALRFCDVMMKIIVDYGIYDSLKEQVNVFCNKQMIDAVKKNIKDKFTVQRFYLSEIHQYAGKKIALYGAGAVGVDYYSQLSRYSGCEVVAWVDQKYAKYDYLYCKVKPTESLLDITYDYILIANNNKNISESIRLSLIAMGVDKKKIIWNAPGFNY